MRKAIFTINGLTKTISNAGKTHIAGQLNINWLHDIFSGHFPGNPVLPGVVQVQMITDTCNEALNTKFILTRASNIKYLNMVVPEICNILSIDIEILQQGSDYGITAILFHKDLIFLKLKGYLTPSSEFNGPIKS
jgi:3-hydroxyacyl-[acyl-carrier-protein] dehydratase